MITVIFNGNARGGRVRASRRRIRAALDEHLGHHEWIETASAEEGREIARSAAEGDVVVAVGGDGSVHTVVEGLWRSDFRATLGILPLGTGNDFAFGIGVPKGLDEAARVLAEGLVRRYDVGEAVLDDGAPFPFANALGVGFDAAASLLSKRRKFLPGVFRYLVSTLETLATWEAPQARVTGGGLDWAEPLMFATIGNAPRSGGGFHITPDADPADGLLDICAVKELSAMRAATLIPKVMAGKHAAFPEVRLATGKKFVVDVDRPVPVHADGEIVSLGCRRVETSIRASCMMVITGGRPVQA
jgi:diacylglycerol kinase (ATP)